jgi:hypothetical protein
MDPKGAYQPKSINSNPANQSQNNNRSACAADRTGEGQPESIPPIAGLL